MTLLIILACFFIMRRMKYKMKKKKNKKSVYIYNLINFTLNSHIIFSENIITDDTSRQKKN